MPLKQLSLGSVKLNELINLFVFGSKLRWLKKNSRFLRMTAPNVNIGNIMIFLPCARHTEAERKKRIHVKGGTINVSYRYRLR